VNTRLFSCEKFPVFEPEKSLFQEGRGRSAQHLIPRFISENRWDGEAFAPTSNCAKFPDTAARPGNGRETEKHTSEFALEKTP
jgi:hypothetical protein